MLYADVLGVLMDSFLPWGKHFRGDLGRFRGGSAAWEGLDNPAGGGVVEAEVDEAS